MKPTPAHCMGPQSKKKKKRTAENFTYFILLPQIVPPWWFASSQHLLRSHISSRRSCCYIPIPPSPAPLFLSPATNIPQHILSRGKIIRISRKKKVQNQNKSSLRRSQCHRERFSFFAGPEMSAEYDKLPTAAAKTAFTLFLSFFLITKG